MSRSVSFTLGLKSSETDTDTTPPPTGTGTNTDSTSGTDLNNTDGNEFAMDPLVVSVAIGAVAIIVVVAIIMYRRSYAIGSN